MQKYIFVCFNFFQITYKQLLCSIEKHFEK